MKVATENLVRERSCRSARCRESRLVPSDLSRLLIPLLPLLLAACPAADDSPDPAVDDAAAPDVAVCLRGEPFVADGAIPLEAPAGGDADRVVGLRWEPHEGCERFVIDLAAEDGSPATAPGHLAAEVRRDLGVVRVQLRDVPRVEPDATDATFDGELARAAYAVWSPEGRWVYVDLHLAGAAEAHAAVLTDPARVVVDLRPGGGPVPPPPASHPRVVVLRPRPGEAAYPLTVTGYARTFEANVVARLVVAGEEVHESFTTSTAWVDAWGHYSITIPGGPAGPVVLHVGEYSAKDGTWDGVVVELRMR